jgi:mannosyl-oligosaccharide glucosidase
MVLSSLPCPKSVAAGRVRGMLHGADCGLLRPPLQALTSQYIARGYLFEQYDDRDGSGTSSHPFTGWTALIALVATGAY